MERKSDHELLHNTFAVREIGLDSLLTSQDQQHQKFTITDNILKRNKELRESLPPTDYFNMIDPYVSKLLVSPKNFSDVLVVANRFPDGLTDFLGFECHLNGGEPHADWALAISGKGKARHLLVDFLNNGHLPKHKQDKPEWKQIRDFVEVWADPQSILHKKILGAWLEFDMPQTPTSVPIPSVFFNPAQINGSTASDSFQHSWFTKIALPSLMGHPLPKMVERNVQKCIQKLQDGTSLFIVGVMLSRETSDVRMSVRFRDSYQIVPYLKSIGWLYDIEPFLSLITDLAKMGANRLILDYDVGRQIGCKIAVECSFSPNKYHEETHWKEFLHYLVEKKLITSEKCDALLQFPGQEQNGFFVRYITHVKIVYEPGHPLKVKAYLAIRHFLDGQITRMHV